MNNTTKVLQRAKQIAADTECTLIEVLLAAVVGALHGNDGRTITTTLATKSIDPFDRD